MRELQLFEDDGFLQTISYDQDKDSDSEKAMWIFDTLLYHLKPGDVLKIVRVR